MKRKPLHVTNYLHTLNHTNFYSLHPQRTRFQQQPQEVDTLLQHKFERALDSYQKTVACLD